MTLGYGEVKLCRQKQIKLKKWATEYPQCNHVLDGSGKPLVSNSTTTIRDFGTRGSSLIRNMLMGIEPSSGDPRPPMVLPPKKICKSDKKELPVVSKSYSPLLGCFGKSYFHPRNGRTLQSLRLFTPFIISETPDYRHWKSHVAYAHLAKKAIAISHRVKNTPLQTGNEKLKWPMLLCFKCCRLQRQLRSVAYDNYIVFLAGIAEWHNKGLGLAHSSCAHIEMAARPLGRSRGQISSVSLLQIRLLWSGGNSR